MDYSSGNYLLSFRMRILKHANLIHIRTCTSTQPNIFTERRTK